MNQEKVVLNKPSVANESSPPIKASDGFPGTLYLADGTSGFAFVQPSSNGFVVIVHGMNDKVEPASVPAPGGWTTRMSQAIQAQLAGVGVPNVLLWDWNKGANPSGVLGLDERNANLQEAILEASTLNEKVLAALTIPYDGETIVAQWAADIFGVRGPAVNQGDALADWMISKIISGEIDPSKPIQLIGHSAGGFVVGECAEKILGNQILLQSSKRPSQLQVTMLDTPYPYRHHVTNVKNPGKVERYVSSVLGAIAPKLALVDDTRIVRRVFVIEPTYPDSTTAAFIPTTPIVLPDAYYHIGNVPPVASTISGFVQNHSEAHEWYLRTVLQPNAYIEGSYYSPFLHHTWSSGPPPAPAFSLNASANDSVPLALGGNSGNQLIAGV